jgi:Spy/CpxP family protein refolding chaperone
MNFNLSVVSVSKRQKQDNNLFNDMKKLILAAAFLSLGTFAMAQKAPVTPEQKVAMEKRRAEMQQNREVKQQQHLSEMQKELNLTKVQVDKIHAIQDRHQAERKTQMQQNQQLRKQKMEGMKLKQQQMDNEMRAILTPEQYQKWQAKKQMKMAERKAKFQHNKDGLGGMKKRQMHKRMHQKKNP